MKAVIALALFAALTTSAASAEQRADDWANLASAIPTRHGTEWITVGRQAGAFHSLRIAAVSGTVQVRSIRVEFSNGRIATFYVARTLDRRHPQAYVELGAPRFIESIAITTARRPAGTYAVFGARGLVPGYDLIATPGEILLSSARVVAFWDSNVGAARARSSLGQGDKPWPKSPRF